MCKNITLSDKYYRLIKSLEGCKLKAYKCPAGRWTIGYGHTEGVVQGMVITQATADNLLKEDSYWKSWDVLKVLPDAKGQELEALTSLIYNIGTSSFQKSTLVKVIKNDNSQISEIAKQWRRWTYVQGKKNKGLINRREKELQHYLGDKYELVK